MNKPQDQLSPALRLDKWLWFARVVKTRALAQELANDGHVRINGQRAGGAAKLVRKDDVLTIALPTRVRVLKITDVAERRGSAADTVGMYEELGK
jgi:ribosome-associated heat shock protein Hsp15